MKSQRHSGIPGWARALILAAVVTAVAAACSGDGNGDGPSQTAAPPPAPVTNPRDPVETPCLSANPAFSERGTVAVLGRSGPDAKLLSGLDWLATPDCERVVFGFLTEESAPASSIGLSRLEFFPDQGILRVTMPRGVDATAVADALVDGALIKRAFVVRSRSGELAVELHMSADTPIEARGLQIGSPARLVVDVRARGDDPQFATSQPTLGPSIVVLSPSPGAADYPLRIRGYARTPDDIVMAAVTGAGPRVERRITAAPSADAWGEFAVTISEGPGDQVVLEVSAGSSEGVEIPLSTP